MKIQFHGDRYFSITGKKVKCLFDPSEGVTEAADFATFSDLSDKSKVATKKNLALPGEFEISGALINTFYSDGNTNLITRVVLEEVKILHFGNIKEMPSTDVFEGLGESIDLIFINLSDDFNEKSAKDLIEKIEPRMVILGGDNTYFPKMVESVGAKTIEDNPLKISKSSLSDDKTEVVILPL